MQKTDIFEGRVFRKIFHKQLFVEEEENRTNENMDFDNVNRFLKGGICCSPYFQENKKYKMIEYGDDSLIRIDSYGIFIDNITLSDVFTYQEIINKIFNDGTIRLSSMKYYYNQDEELYVKVIRRSDQNEVYSFVSGQKNLSDRLKEEIIKKCAATYYIINDERYKELAINGINDIKLEYALYYLVNNDKNTFLNHLNPEMRRKYDMVSDELYEANY